MSFFGPFLVYVEQGTIVLLAILSVWSIGLMVERRRLYRSLNVTEMTEEAERLIGAGELGSLRTWAEKTEGLIPGLITTLLNSRQHVSNLEPAARGYLQKERLKLEKGLNVLATLGSNAPFIGLFGTVLGIIDAFAALATEQAGSEQVMASIAVALLATAMGLFVAVPAVIAFNTFSNRLRIILSSCESVKNLYLSRLTQDREAA